MTARALFVSSLVSVTPMVGRRRCCFWVWDRVREVFGLLWALRAGFPAGASKKKCFSIALRLTLVVLEMH